MYETTRPWFTIRAPDEAHIMSQTFFVSAKMVYTCYLILLTLYVFGPLPAFLKNWSHNPYAKIWRPYLVVLSLSWDHQAFFLRRKMLVFERKCNYVFVESTSESEFVVQSGKHDHGLMSRLKQGQRQVWGHTSEQFAGVCLSTWLWHWLNRPIKRIHQRDPDKMRKRSRNGRLGNGKGRLQ